MLFATPVVPRSQPGSCRLAGIRHQPPPSGALTRFLTSTHESARRADRVRSTDRLPSDTVEMGDSIQMTAGQDSVDGGDSYPELVHDLDGPSGSRIRRSTTGLTDLAGAIGPVQRPAVTDRSYRPRLRCRSVRPTYSWCAGTRHCDQLPVGRANPPRQSAAPAFPLLV